MTSTDKHPMIPFEVIVKAADGDPVAINKVVAHYSGFIGHYSCRKAFYTDKKEAKKSNVIQQT